MIGLTGLQELLSYAVASGAVLDEPNPTSIILVAPPESGKTSLIKQFEHQPWTHFINDATAYGLATKDVPFMNKEGLRVMLIPDLTNPLSRSRDTVKTFTSFIASMVEEGATRIHTGSHDLDLPFPFYSSLISSMTPSELHSRHYWWATEGFLSRFLLASFEYDAKTVALIDQFILTPRSTNGVKPISFPRKALHVGYTPKLLQPVIRLSKEFMEAWGMMGEGGKGWRAERNIKMLILGRAFLKERPFILPEDVECVVHLVRQYCLKMPPRPKLKVEMV